MTPHETARVRVHLMPAPEHPTPALPATVLSLLLRLHNADLVALAGWREWSAAYPGEGYYRHRAAQAEYAARTVRWAISDGGHPEMAGRMAMEALGVLAVVGAENANPDRESSCASQ